MLLCGKALRIFISEFFIIHIREKIGREWGRSYWSTATRSTISGRRKEKSKKERKSSLQLFSTRSSTCMRRKISCSARIEEKGRNRKKSKVRKEESTKRKVVALLPWNSSRRYACRTACPAPPHWWSTLISPMSFHQAFNTTASWFELFNEHYIKTIIHQVSSGSRDLVRFPEYYTRSS